ncbi:MAG: pilus assembly PilX N-terminal domain-containing protein [Planctomycetota bacterium]
MTATVKNTLNNESGMVLIIVLLMLVIVTILGIAATRTSDTEMQIASNERQLVNDFYVAEGGLIGALETPPWLTDPVFLTAAETAASYTGTVDFNADGTPDANVEVRCIEDTGASVAGLSTAANNLPVSPHIAPPPAGSGYSLGKFEVRRYGVTVTSATGNTRVQTGVWKVFNKF